MDKQMIEVFVSRIIVDWKNDHWIWSPTVQQSLLVIDNGKVKVVKSRKNYHIATSYIGECFDNYEQAFSQAVNRLKSYKDEDFRVTESNFERQFGELEEWKKRFDNMQRREVVFEDLANKEKRDGTRLEAKAN